MVSGSASTSMTSALGPGGFFLELQGGQPHFHFSPGISPDWASLGAILRDEVLP